MEAEDMYQTLKGRLRRPSAKALASNLKSPEPVLVAVKSVLSLQSGVAEIVMNDDELAEEPIEARPEAVTVETVMAADWREKGFEEKRPKTPRRSAVKREPKISTTPKLELDQDLIVAKTEEKPLLVPVEPVPFIEPVGEHDDDDSQSETSVRPDGSMPGASPTEVKRKRGRPFKGQEKPVEERLMIETSKIRRLIDDIMRKGTAESELCLRLRNIAKDLDEVMSIGFAHVAVEEETNTALPPTLDNDLIPAELSEEPTAPVVTEEPVQ